MNVFLTNILKRVSEFLVHRKGLPVLAAAALVFLNLIVRMLPAWPWLSWLQSTDLLLHLGIILGLLGILLGDAL